MEPDSQRPPARLIEYCVFVHTLPEDLREPLAIANEHLRETSELYRFAVESRLLWRVWLVDEFGMLWIEVNRMGQGNRPEFHTLRLDEGSFDRIPCEPYPVEGEESTASDPG